MYYIGVDIGGTGIQAGVVTEKGKIIAKVDAPTPKAVTNQGLASLIADLCKKSVEDAGISMSEVKSIGLGCPGSVDDKNGVVLYSNNIKMENFTLCDEVHKHIEKPIYIGNDANCAALGEYFALNDDSITEFIAVTLGTGVGGGIIINRKLYTGSNGVAGELGHTVIRSGGEDCSCGRKGCWEAYASATALIRETEKMAKENPDSILNDMIRENGGKANGKIPWDAMQGGDAAAKTVIDKYIEDITEGLANLINIFQPQLVAIGGGVSRQGDNLLKPINAILDDKCYGNTKAPDVVAAKLGNDAGIIGAAFLGK